jgi:hypothetical protein
MNIDYAKADCSERRECLKNGVSACWPDMLTQFLGWQKGNRR